MPSSPEAGLNAEPRLHADLVDVVQCALRALDVVDVQVC
jgi:hypothetical protein